MFKSNLYFLLVLTKYFLYIQHRENLPIACSWISWCRVYFKLSFINKTRSPFKNSMPRCFIQVRQGQEYLHWY